LGKTTYRSIVIVIDVDDFGSLSRLVVQHGLEEKLNWNYHRMSADAEADSGVIKPLNDAQTP